VVVYLDGKTVKTSAIQGAKTSENSSMLSFVLKTLATMVEGMAGFSGRL
jgi:hypothetical protein